MFNQLRKVLCDINGNPLTENCILAASPLCKQPSTNPYRIVLIIYHSQNEQRQFTNGQFVVYDQTWENNYMLTEDSGECLCPPIHKGHYYTGSYFALNRFAEAMARWCERCQQHIKFMPSIYREIHAA